MAGSKGWFNLETAGAGVPETQFFEGDSAFSKLGLTRTQRLYGFAGCFGVGFLLSILGTVFLFLGALTTFACACFIVDLGGIMMMTGASFRAVLYAIGTVVSLIGTGFLIGFFKQVKMMFKPVRVVATILFLVSIGLIFVGAFVLNSGILCIIFVIIEYLAFLWYTLSYIPYARSAVLKVFGMS
ncbi:hypothetical protein HETIRDRAFT_379793 [Heterobasidion irregulare TC 32-1]|uniref:Protein transport protein SFT2 n=1 Tax=Heterobasidion irregulare (strain TC 32-1) TaxID=747525 RepID=W4KKW7_HETIT|nr:uncharacterized protein HETIRDRAFT_379793 [Heterobasidion irregulare TC 32-1]ETW85711.1 hypothetical protein HETIRDRAFT_379793 [Heterobasidion irregulare TC 32-1]